MARTRAVPHPTLLDRTPGRPRRHWIIGAADDGDDLSLCYFDSRGLHRVYAVSMGGNRLRMWRDEPAFAQRFTGDLRDDGTTLDWPRQLCRDGSAWDDDLEILFRRAPSEHRSGPHSTALERREELDTARRRDAVSSRCTTLLWKRRSSITSRFSPDVHDQRDGSTRAACE